jgi:hypothetical protein
MSLAWQDVLRESISNNLVYRPHHELCLRHWVSLPVPSFPCLGHRLLPMTVARSDPLWFGRVEDMAISGSDRKWC